MVWRFETEAPYDRVQRVGKSHCQPRIGLATIALMSLRDKILSQEELGQWRHAARAARRKVVATNGCFDLLHAGHVTYLETARAQGDLLLVGVNGDDSVRQLKGAGRPLNPEADRALVIAALQSVDAVFIFPEKRAVNFLRLAQPDIYVKGGDYTPETLDPDEREVIQQAGGRTVIIPFVPGKSTTGLIQKMGGG